jgi:hypothetical protein
MTIRKREHTGRGNTKSQSVENLLWKVLWTCLRQDYILNDFTGSNVLMLENVYYFPVAVGKLYYEI